MTPRLTGDRLDGPLGGGIALRGKWERLLADSRRHAAPEALPFPTDAQLDLLKAALLPAEQAAPAWRRWKARGLQIDTVADRSIRLFPLLWTNRHAAGVGAEDLPILKGNYRRVFADSAVKLRAALDAGEILTEARIPVLFFKGAAMIALNDQNRGLRLIGDVDVLVPEHDARRATTLLLAAGYRPKFDPEPQPNRIHSWDCTNPDGLALDVHWWAFKEAGDDRSMFANARQANLLGRPILIPSATDCLITAVADAFPNEGAPLTWIADVMTIFRVDGDQIDWGALLERSHRPGLTLPLVDGLSFLVREFALPVPAYVIDELRARRISWRERAAHWSWLTRPPVGGRLLVLLERHRAFRLHQPAVRPRDFLWYLAQSSGVRRRDVVVKRAPRRAIRAVALLVLRTRLRRQRRTQRHGIQLQS